MKMYNTVQDCLYGKRKRPVAGIVLNVIIGFFIVVLVAEFIFGLNYAGIYVVNVSMTPTVNGANIVDYTEDGRPIADDAGDYIYIRKGAKPSYGDIVVVYRENVKDNIIKRAVAFEGDRVKFVEGYLYVNGELVEESYISDEFRTSPGHMYYNYPRGGGEHTVGKNAVFLLGDNRNHSDDSRKYGDYPMSSVIGVVPGWSLTIKGFTTAVHKFFYFTISGRNTTVSA